jgi:acetoin utilization protein AcuB
MTRAIISAHPGESVEAVRERLRAHGIHHLIVIDNGTVVGVVSPRDLMAAGKLTVGEVMHREVVSVEAAATLKRAAALMIGNPSGCLPVLEEGKLAGIITTSDLMRVFSLEQTIA